MSNWQILKIFYGDYFHERKEMWFEEERCSEN